ncbi:hypothetical protein DRQ33_00565 [bacterium]|nr:MAG: hypothetical protein DRQ33_00565 [bacterium]
MGIGATESKLEIFAKVGEVSSNKELRLVNPDNFTKQITFGIRLNNSDKNIPPLPQPSWVEIIPETIKIAPNTTSEPVEIKIAIPDSARYYNRKYSFELVVHQGKTGAFVAGVIVPVMIKTEPTRKPHRDCEDCQLMIYPSILIMESKLDSICIVNWNQDTIRLKVGWNRPEQEGWQEALLLMEQVMTTYVPLENEFTMAPGEKKKIFIKPLAFPGKGKLYFSDSNGIKDYLDLMWREM